MVQQRLAFLLASSGRTCERRTFGVSDHPTLLLCSTRPRFNEMTYSVLTKQAECQRSLFCLQKGENLFGVPCLHGSTVKGMMQTVGFLLTAAVTLGACLKRVVYKTGCSLGNVSSSGPGSLALRLPHAPPRPPACPPAWPRGPVGCRAACVQGGHTASGAVCPPCPPQDNCRRSAFVCDAPRAAFP